MARLSILRYSTYLVIVNFWMNITVQCTTDSAFVPTDMKSAARRNTHGDWIAFGSKDYQFVLDTARRLDKNRNDAKAACMSRNADLVSIETEHELEFIKNQVKTNVKVKGQHMISSSWWTNGVSYKLSHWIWDTPTAKPVQISALKRHSVPRTGTHYLALSHSGGWRLKIVPGTFLLRYICQRERLPQSTEPPTFSDNRDPDVNVRYNLTDKDVAAISSSLRIHLFSGYNNHVPSHPGHGTTTHQGHDDDVIRMEVGLVHVEDNAAAKLLTVKQTIKTIWRDTRLSWRPNMYGGMQYIRTHITDVWLPTINILDSSGTLKDSCRNRDPQNLVTINASGYLTLDRTCDVLYNCTLEKPAAFPFDHKQCRIFVFIEQGDNALVAMTWDNEESTLDRSFHRTWRVSSFEGAQVDWSRPVNATDTFVVAQLTLYLHRNVLYHILTLLVPCLFLAVVLIIGIWLPHGSAVKCVTTVLVTLAFVLYLTIGGQHTHRRILTYSDMFMIVMSVTGAVALITQICIMRLVKRHEKRQQPPLLVERSRNNTINKYKDIKCHQMAALDKGNRRDNVTNMWLDENEAMLNEQHLGLTTISNNTRVRRPHDQYSTPTSDQRVVQTRDQCATPSFAKSHTHFSNKSDRSANSKRVAIHNRTTTVHFQPDPHTQVLNGNSWPAKHNQSPCKVRETPLFAHATSDVQFSGSRDSAPVSGAESFDSGCHCETKNSLDVQVVTKHSKEYSTYKKCIALFDRVMSVVISATIIITILVFLMLFLTA